MAYIRAACPKSLTLIQSSPAGKEPSLTLNADAEMLNAFSCICVMH